MNTALELDVTVSALRPAGAFLECEVRVHNRSARTLLAVCEVRAIHWHPETRTVELRLHGGGGTGACRAASVPRTRAVAAGETMVIPVRLPAVLHRLRPRASADPEIHAADLREAVAVEAHVGIADGPFYFTPDGPPAREQLATWGHCVRARPHDPAR